MVYLFGFFFFFARLGTAIVSTSGNRDLIVIFKCSQKCDSLNV